MADNVSLSDFDIAAINAARSVLKEFGERLMKLDYAKMPEAGYQRDSRFRSIGFVEGQADRAEHALFSFLNFAHNHLHIEMTDEQLHNRKEEGDE